MKSRRAILCVDDEAIILIALRQELKAVFGAAFIYETALDAYGGFRVIDELVEDGIEVVLIISDWLMPGMRGDEFLARVARTHPSIKAIMITGQADPEAMDRVGSSPNVLAVLRKPWRSEQLVDVIKEHCSGGACDQASGGES